MARAAADFFLEFNHYMDKFYLKHDAFFQPSGCDDHRT